MILNKSTLSKEELAILMALISEKIVEMKQKHKVRHYEIDMDRFEKMVLLSVKIENEWYKVCNYKNDD